MAAFDLSRVEVVPELPSRFPSGRGQPMPGGLVGAEIVTIGTPPDGKLVEGGGLVIDYRRPGERSVRRIVFAFNETGMWEASQGLLPTAATPV